MGRVRLSRGAEEKRPVSFISAPSFCGVRVAEPSLVLLANPNVAASALLRRVVACFAYSELKTDRTDTVAELSRVWSWRVGWPCPWRLGSRSRGVTGEWSFAFGRMQVAKSAET